jgi:hypothetical protein
MLLVFALDLLLQPFCGLHELVHAHSHEHATLEMVQERSDCHLHSVAYSCVHYAPCIPATALLSVHPQPKSRLNDGFGLPPQSEEFGVGPFRPPCLG